MPSRDRPSARSGAVPRSRSRRAPALDDGVHALEVLTDEPLVAASTFDDHDRVAEAVSTSADQRLGVLEHPFGGDRLVAIGNDRRVTDAPVKSAPPITLMSV